MSEKIEQDDSKEEPPKPVEWKPLFWIVLGATAILIAWFASVAAAIPS